MEAVTKIYNPDFLRRVRARRAEKERREREARDTLLEGLNAASRYIYDAIKAHRSDDAALSEPAPK